MNRRKFLQKLGIGTAAVAAGGVAIADDPSNWTDTYPYNPHAIGTVITDEALEDMLVARAMETDANGLLVNKPAGITSGSDRRMLQAGINDIFEKEYGHL